MKKGRSPISHAESYKEISEFWDTHDLHEFWDQSEPVKFEVDVASEVTYYELDKRLSDRVQTIAHQRGISPDTLINLWVQKKLQEQA
jgi:hypothetical protein